MAALIVVAGLAIAEKVEKKKAAKRLKKANDEDRYRQLQIETNSRLARTQSGNIIQNTFVDEPEQDDQEEHLHSAVDDDSPPAYDVVRQDAVTVGEQRERQWQAQMMQRRRSSVYSQGSGQAVTGSVRIVGT